MEGMLIEPGSLVPPDTVSHTDPRHPIFFSLAKSAGSLRAHATARRAAPATARAGEHTPTSCASVGGSGVTPTREQQHGECRPPPPLKRIPP